jgi:hypothetical protein
MVITPAVTAYTSGTITYEVQWSNDGVNFFSADPKDTFANITAVNPGVIKVVQVKAPFYRVTWTTGAYTHTIQDGAVTNSEWGSTPSPYGYELGAGAMGPATVGLIGSTTLAAAFNPATPTTYSAITAVPMIPNGGPQAGRLALKLNATADTWTASPQFEVLWVPTGVGGVGNILHADPTDIFASQAGAFTAIKELAVKAPFFVVAMTVGTPGTATFTVDAIPTAF